MHSIYVLLTASSFFLIGCIKVALGDHLQLQLQLLLYSFERAKEAFSFLPFSHANVHTVETTALKWLETS